MAEPDYSKVFETYNKLPQDFKKEFDDFRVKNYSKGSPPPEQMQKDLEGILAKHQPKTKSYASSRAVGHGRMQYATGLAAVLIAVALASAGMPDVPLPLN